MAITFLQGDQLTLPTDTPAVQPKSTQRHISLTICPDDDNPADIYATERDGIRSACIDAQELEQFLEELLGFTPDEWDQADQNCTQDVSIAPDDWQSWLDKYGFAQ